MYDSNTPYDDVFRTLLTDCRKLLLPVVNEIFHETYTGQEQILLKENEIFLRQQSGEEKKITDSVFAVIANGFSKNYHLECQSSPDGSIIIRMYEYDSQIALKESTIENGILNVYFPQSAVLYLRHSQNTPDTLKICIHTPNGSVSYEIPALKVKMYSVDEIFAKKLLFFIPFYIFTYEDHFAEIEQNKEKLQRLKHTYNDIAYRLDALCNQNLLDSYTRQTILEMSEKVISNIAQKYEKIKEVNKIMGGHILEYKAKDILREGIQQGREQSQEQIIQKMLAKEMTPEQIANLLDMDVEAVKKLASASST